MILTNDVIVGESAKGRLSVDPLELDQIGPASIDLHLGNEIRVVEGGPPGIGGWLEGRSLPGRHPQGAVESYRLTVQHGVFHDVAGESRELRRSPEA